MQSPAPESYLVTEAMTAAPQKLHLMLVDGAVRYSQRALAQWNQGRNEDAGESLARAQEIVTEMICGLDADAQPELVGKLRSVYLFIFRSLSQAALEHSEERVSTRIPRRPRSSSPPAPRAAATVVVDDAPAEAGGFSLEA